MKALCKRCRPKQKRLQIAGSRPELFSRHHERRRCRTATRQVRSTFSAATENQTVFSSAAASAGKATYGGCSCHLDGIDAPNGRSAKPAVVPLKLAIHGTEQAPEHETRPE
jgi:hypothetical protein